MSFDECDGRSPPPYNCANLDLSFRSKQCSNRFYHSASSASLTPSEPCESKFLPQGEPQKCQSLSMLTEKDVASDKQTPHSLKDRVTKNINQDTDPPGCKFDWNKVDEKEFLRLRGFLYRQDWALEYYDKQDGFHVAVEGITEATARQLLEKENFKLIPIKFVELMGGIYNKNYLIHPGNMLRTACNIRAVFSGTVGSCPQRLHGLTVAHFIKEIPDEAEIRISTSVVLPSNSWEEQATVFRDWMLFDDVYAHKDQMDIDRITADIALLILADGVESRNQIKIDANNNVGLPCGIHKISLSRKKLMSQRGEPIFLRNQYDQLVQGEIRHLSFTSKKQNLYNTVAVTTVTTDENADVFQPITRPGDSGAPAWVSPEEDSNVIDVVGIVIGYIRLNEDRGMTIVNNLGEVFRYCPLFGGNSDAAGFYDSCAGGKPDENRTVNHAQGGILNLPAGVFEQVLVKAFVMQNKIEWKRTSRPKHASYLKLASVCAFFRLTATSREWFTCNLKKQLSITGDIRIRKRRSLKMDGVINGLAELNGKIYILCTEPNTIHVYESETLEALPNLAETKIRSPWDIVACKKLKCLYVAERSIDNLIWRLTEDGKRIQKWLIADASGMKMRKFKLSVTTDGQLLVLKSETQSIAIYNEEPALQAIIKLPQEFTEPCHVVQTQSASFIVCYGYKDPLTSMNCLLLLSKEGQVIKSFEGEDVGPLNEPSHLALDHHGNVYVVDAKNHRVLMMNESLDNCKILLGPRQDRISGPARVHLLEGGDLLVIGMRRRHSFVFKGPMDIIHFKIVPTW